MSTAPDGAQPVRHLRLATDTTPASSAATSARAACAAARPALLRVCAGEVLLLDDGDVDLVDLVNRSSQIGPWLLDDTADPTTTGSLRCWWSTCATATASSAVARATGSPT